MNLAIIRLITDRPMSFGEEKGFVEKTCDLQLFEFNTVPDKILITFLGITNILIFALVGCAANTLALQYFFTKRNIHYLAFRAVAITDLSISIMSVFVGASYLDGLEPTQFFQNDLICELWSRGWWLAVRLSVHLVCLQSCLRGLRIWIPLRQVITERTFLIIILADLAIILLPDVLPDKVVRHTFVPALASCSVSYPILDESDERSTDLSPFDFIYGRLHVLLFILPLPFIGGSCLACCCKLIQQKYQMKKRLGDQHLSNTRVRCLVTIMMFTITCLAFNLPAYMEIVAVRESRYVKT